jgi:lipopolysaccharide/colanic/teichoic acid biosynthesis glycosyltransferase
MSKSGFLTYRQGLTIAVPGSRRRTERFGWNPAPGALTRLTAGLRGAVRSGEMLIRESIVSNLILIAWLTYSFTAGLASGVHSGVMRRELSVSRAAKRFVDIIGSLFGLMLLSPIMMLAALAIKLDSEGPVFFTQMRVGLNRRKAPQRDEGGNIAHQEHNRERRRRNLYGKPFKVYKFRSMIDNAEKKSGPIWAARNDPRVTRVGALLRKSRFDEVPQLVNVLRGEMSLVGPRPERPVFIESFVRDISEYAMRLDVKPGITGLAQVVNGYDTSVSSVRAKVRQDLSYINSWSLLKDIKILMQTVIVVITGKGAF